MGRSKQRSLSLIFAIACGIIGASVILVSKMHLGDSSLSAEEREEIENKQYTIGLALSGGGAKGAYEVGVWRALEELGLSNHIGVFSGTSIGAINSALFATGETAANCETIWRELISKVFSLDETISGESMIALVENGMNAVLDANPNWMEKLMRSSSGETGVCDAGNLRRILRTYLPRQWKRRAPYVYVTAQQKDTQRVERFRLNGLSGVDYVDRIMASAACPILFPPAIVDGVTYVDGGIEEMGGDNTPIAPVLGHKNIKKLIVVYLQSRAECKTTCEMHIPPTIEVVRIYPSQNISGEFGLLGTIDTSNETVTRLIAMGYADAMSVLVRSEFGKRIER